MAALNPEIVQLVASIQGFAVAQGITEQQAFKVALVRICKAWATGQTIPKSEAAVLDDACQKLNNRLSLVSGALSGAVATVAANHQAEVDAIVSGVVIPE